VLQVAQVEAVDLDGVADLGSSDGAILSDLGEAGLVGLGEGTGGEAQDVAYAGAVGGAAGGFWSGIGGFGAVAAGVAVGGSTVGKADNSPGGSDGVDTSVVVFDLTTGVSSDHSGRTFSGAESYDIYVIVDQNDAGAFGDIDWESVVLSGNFTWSGGENLGSDDSIHLVLATGRMTMAGDTSYQWSSIDTSTMRVSSGWASMATKVTSFGSGTIITIPYSTEWHRHSASLLMDSNSVVARLFDVSKTKASFLAPSTGTSAQTFVFLIDASKGSGTPAWTWNGSANADILFSVPAGLLTTQGLA
jgi:hypothetical protein